MSKQTSHARGNSLHPTAVPDNTIGIKSIQNSRSHERIYSSAPASASAAATGLHANAAGRNDSAPLTCAPVRFEGDELPHIWKLRK